MIYRIVLLLCMMGIAPTARADGADRFVAQLRPGCPVIVVDAQERLAITPWVCTPQSGKDICRASESGCIAVGIVEARLFESYPRDLNVHLFRYRPFYRSMTNALTASLLDGDTLAAVGAMATHNHLTGVTRSGKTVDCQLTGEIGVKVSEPDDIRTTTILIDMKEDDHSIEPSALTKQCSGFLTSTWYLPQMGFACETAPSDQIFALLNGNRWLGAVTAPTDKERCREEFPEYLSAAGHQHNLDGLDHNYFDFRTRAVAGQRPKKLALPPLKPTAGVQYFAPMTHDLVAMLSQRTPELADDYGSDFTVEAVMALRNDLMRSKHPVAGVDIRFEQTSAFLDQAFRARMQRQEFHRLDTLHAACDEFHRTVLAFEKDPRRAAAYLPRCGHVVSALQTLILRQDPREQLGVSDWVGQILTVPTALAVLDVLTSDRPEQVLKALDVYTDEQLGAFRSSNAAGLTVH